MKRSVRIIVLLCMTLALTTLVPTAALAAVEPVQFCRAQAQGAEVSPGESAVNQPVIIEYSGSGECTPGTTVTSITAQIHYYDVNGNSIAAGSTSCAPPNINGSADAGWTAAVRCQLIGLPASSFYNRMYRVDVTLGFTFTAHNNAQVASVTTNSYRFFVYGGSSNNAGDAQGSCETTELGSVTSTTERTMTVEASAVCGALLTIQNISLRVFRFQPGTGWVQVFNSVGQSIAICPQNISTGQGTAVVRCTISAGSLPAGVTYRVLSGVGYAFEPRLGLSLQSSNGNNYYFLG